MRYLKYHGQRREKDPAALLNKEVVLTTYETVSADFARGDSVLYKVAWFRIVLDEGKCKNALHIEASLMRFQHTTSVDSRRSDSAPPPLCRHSTVGV